MEKVHHRTIKANGINIHIAEQGTGPLVILCHGFPELWYSWRHQLSALAEAGYHAVAPDQRGYGRTDRPVDIDAYTIFHLTGDMVGLIHALGEEQAVIAGHDWGSRIAWHCALLRPDMFRGVVLSSVPYVPRCGDESDTRPTDKMRLMAGDKQFYQLYFQEPGKAEAELEADVRKTLLTLFYSGSANASPEQSLRFFFEKSEKFLDTASPPDILPDWITEQDISFFVKEFTRTGFSGGLNWYRNLDTLWEQTYFLMKAKIFQPVLYVGGEKDAVITNPMYKKALENLNTSCPNLTKKVFIPDAGHWVQQEQPEYINKLYIEFLENL